MRGVLDYRAAVLAYDRFQAKDTDALLGNPALMRILVRMNRAQRGLELDSSAADEADAAGAILRAATPEPDTT